MTMLGRIYKEDYRAGSLKEEQNFSRLRVERIGVRYQKKKKNPTKQQQQQKNTSGEKAGMSQGKGKVLYCLEKAR